MSQLLAVFLIQKGYWKCSLSWELAAMQSPGTFPALLIQNLHFNE